MHPQAPQTPFFPTLKRNYLTEQELDAPIPVVQIRVWGNYTKRGEHRKEVVQQDFTAEIEVPMGFNRGHVKLSCNRYVRVHLKGIRVREYHIDESYEPVPLEHKRRVRDFISKRGMRDNERSKKEYQRELEKRQNEARAIAEGQPPQFIDDTVVGADGLPELSEQTYLAK